MRSLLHELFPPVRAEALRLLFAPESRELHLRELSRRSKLGIGPWQRELAKLEKQDLVHRRVDGNRRYFRANKDHPIYPELASLAAKTNGLQEILKEALKGIEGVRVAFVFGSLAQGSGKASSDVDLMLIGNVGLRDIASRLRTAIDSVGREINPVVMSPSGFSSKLKGGDAFLRNVMAAEKIFIVGSVDELGSMG